MPRGPADLRAGDKAGQVRSMFGQLATRYDLINQVLSLGIHRRWRRTAVRRLAIPAGHPGYKVLDVCCGTGDLALALSSRANVYAVDFSHPMLVVAKRKIEGSPILLVEADALKLPFPDSAFDAVTIAFGLRNLAKTEEGLSEMLRVLRPGGRVAVLEFSKPVVPLISSWFNFYFRRILPRLGNLLSGSSYAYTYLRDSVSGFPDQEALARTMRGVGFSEVTYYNLSGGIAALHVGERCHP